MNLFLHVNIIRFLQYVFMFQAPLIPEFTLSLNDYGLFEELFVSQSGIQFVNPPPLTFSFTGSFHKRYKP